MLARRITKLRKKYNMSQADLAKALNITPSAEGMYEQGRRIPGLNILIAMSEVFDVSLDYLITGKEHHHQNSIEQLLAEDCPCRTCYWKNYLDT